MQCNLRISRLHRYDNDIKTKTINPRLCFNECCCCGMSFKKEKMYRLRYYHFGLFSEQMSELIGCRHCFSSEKDLKEYAKKNNRIMPDDVHAFTEKYLLTPDNQHTNDDIENFAIIELMY